MLTTDGVNSQENIESRILRLRPKELVSLILRPPPRPRFESLPVTVRPRRLTETEATRPPPRVRPLNNLIRVGEPPRDGWR